MEFVDEERIPVQPYPELREVLHAFVEEVAAELAENLAGIYLVGSLATGDFDLDSDVDFLVVTSAELSEANQKALQEIQTRIHDMDAYPAKHLEGSYISLSDLTDASTVGEKELYYFDNGSTTAEETTHDNRWHVRWILRERGLTLVGQKPSTLLAPIPCEALIDEVKAVMRKALEYFQADLDGPRSFFNSRFGQSFFVLTYCRMLHTIRTGSVQSKKAGMEWAKGFVDPRWVKLIDQAWEEREGVRYGIKVRQRAESGLLYETLEFMKYAIAFSEK